MKKISIGILAHVDAGKTTLSEALLYFGGNLKAIGRVDNRDAFLDIFHLEKERGITIFSKQAKITTEHIEITLIDTPGHVDFSTEMERTLQVLDYAVLVISGADGLQGHTLTLYKLLETYRIPTFLFVNKMDQAGTDKQLRLEELKNQWGSEVIDFTLTTSPEFYEEIALCGEHLLDQFLETAAISPVDIGKAIAARRIFPCYFGSALGLVGVAELLKGLETYALMRAYPKEFGARVFKITRDEKGGRLTHLKITGGCLRVKDVLPTTTEKVNQIRQYSGEKYLVRDEVVAGDICAVTGPEKTFAGQGLGREQRLEKPLLAPVLTYQMVIPEEFSVHELLPRLQPFAEEDPSLKITFNEQLQSIQVQIMGEVQLQIVKQLIKDRLSIDVDFISSQIIYKETIADTVYGVGHFEPLRHYAEVQLLLEPGPPGSGMIYENACSEDLLAPHYQRQIMKHLEEKTPVGVLWGAEVTDLKVTLIAGKAHPKHTEGGDFREATYRALRQGLMEARSLLLEPYYEFQIEAPLASIGRVIAELEKRNGSFTGPEITEDIGAFWGRAPVQMMTDFSQEFTSFTKGLGKFFCTLKGYEPCYNQEEVLKESTYSPERDLENPTGSVFCSHGAGFTVPWDQVKEHMHLPAYEKKTAVALPEETSPTNRTTDELVIGTEEIEAIISRTSGANKKSDTGRKIKKREPLPTVKRVIKAPKKLDAYLLVDGYNVIYSWDDLKALAATDIGAARDKLLDILCNYQAIKGWQIIVVFDAYRVAGGQVREMDYHNLHVVYTKEAETADAYIERFAHTNKKKYDITVATSDAMEQLIIRGADAKLLSSRELAQDISKVNQEILEDYQNGEKH